MKMARFVRLDAPQYGSSAERREVAEVHGSRTHPRPRKRPRNGFEDREAHRDPRTSQIPGQVGV